MGVAITDEDEDGLSLRDTPSPEGPPILSKLHDHGYIAEDSEIPTLVSLLFNSMDGKALLLLDRILSDLESITHDSQNLKSVVSDLRVELDHEKHENLKLSDENVKLSHENEKLVDENKELHVRIQELEENRLGVKTKKKERGGHEDDEDDEDGQVLQWRAQSLHQLQELEHMNQALRNALSRYTALPSSTSEKPCGGGHIAISQDLAPSATQCSTPKESEPLSSEQRNGMLRYKRENYDQSEDKHADLKRELKVMQEELSAKNKEIERLSLMVEASMNVLQNESDRNTQSVYKNSSEELNPGISGNAARVEEDKFGAKIERLKMTVEEQECKLLGIRSQLEQKKEQLSFIMDEKVVLEEALSSSQSECKQLASLIKELDQRMTQLQKAVTTRTTERDSALATEKQEADAWKHAEEELQKKCNHLISNLKALEEQQLALKTERDELKKKEELDKSKHEKALEDLKKCQSQVESAQKETEQLKSLVTQLDSTREELVENLKMSMADRLLSENQVKLLEIEMYRLSEEVDMRNAEIGNLHKLFENLGNENDQLHAEIKTRDEEYLKFEEENNRLNIEIRQLRKGLENAEQKLHGETLAVQKSESEVLSLRDRLCMEEESRKAAEDRCAAKAAELESLAEHLTTTTCEFQLVKAEFLQVASDRENLVEDLKDVTSRLNYCQQLISAKEEEEKALSNSYNQLVEEYQQLKLAVMELDAQAQQQAYQLKNAEDLHRTSQEHSNFLEEECRKLKNHVKEMENQVDNLQCSLSQRSNLIESMQREKAALISQIASLKKMTFEIEEKNKSLIREVTASESNNQMLMGVIQGKIQEAESYVAKYRMEHERVRELDQLVAYFRTQEHQLQMEIKDANAKNAIMKDRLASLEEKIRLLQKSKDSQREETFRLTNLLKDKSNEENRRCNALHPHDDFMLHRCAHSTDSESKLQELELKTMSLAVDLSKTEALYKDCLLRLQKAEAQRAEQKSEYDHVLSILSKVDDDRLQLQQRCRQLVNVVGLGDTTTANNNKGSNIQLEQILEKPEMEGQNKSL